MNQNFKRLLSIIGLFFSTYTYSDSSCASDCCPTTCAQSQNLYQPHAFNASMSREIMLEKAAWFPMSDEEGWHGTFGVGFDYMHSFNPASCTVADICPGRCSTLGSLPFWAADGSSTMTLGDNNDNRDMDVYQIGLGPVTTTGTVTLNPIVFQAGADFLLYVGAHKTERGFFLKIHAPVGVISIDPNLCYTDTITAVDYPQGILNNAAATVTAPYENIEQAFAGGSTAGFLKAMVFGLISCKRTSSAQFGDMEFALGYNFFADENKHLGLAVRFSAPTGNSADGVYVLEPIFGRNGHWGAGGELIGHWKFWESDSCDDCWAQMFFDGVALHLFKSKHSRSFDLKDNGLGSKYLLLAKYSTAIPGVFQSEIINAVNITTVGVQSTFAVEGNFAFGLDFHWRNWSFEVGYEGWGRTCEQLCLDCTCPGSTNYNEYAVLGRQAPFSSADGITATNLCEPGATISTSQARVNAATATIVLATTAANRLPEDPDDALDVDGQRARAVYTSKPYAELRYTWSDSDYVPYLAVTGGAEIPNTHKNEAVKFWNIGVNGGMAF